MLDRIYDCINLNEQSRDFLFTIEKQMAIVADLSRADFLLYGRLSEKKAIVLSHTRPHSLAHVYLKRREGTLIDINRRPEVMRTFFTGHPQGEVRSTIVEGAPVVRQTWPIYYPHPFVSPNNSGASEKPKVVAVVVAAINLIEYERHRLRSNVYRRALKRLQTMLLYGQVLGSENLTSFGEQDGIIFTDCDGIIRYSSGIGANIYRRVGYREALVGRPLAAFETEDEALRREAIGQNHCIERETKENDRIWIHKALPLVTYSPHLSPGWWPWFKNFGLLPIRQKRYGVVIAINDVTESRRQDETIRIKNAMIQEVHHRVKNNLQTIAGLLRMQMRRVESAEARQALDEALTRILSVAVIHEFLSSDSSNIINIKEVCQRIITQFQQSMFDPDKNIRLKVDGESIYIPARQATACSLIVNELLQNSLEHGFAHKQSGFIHLNLADNGDEVIMKVIDDGDGLPSDFSLNETHSLGLQIIKILVEDDLKGQIHFAGRTEHGQGLSVTIKFPKSLFKGEAGWIEHASS